VTPRIQQFSQWWQGETQARRGMPAFARLWGLAVHERDRQLRGKVSDSELFELVVTTLLYCARHFDEEHPPKTGLCRARDEDRFVWFFARKLGWELQDHRRRLRRERALRGDGRYRGPRGEEYEAARQPKSRSALLEMVHRALGRLDENERDLLDLRYWQGAAYEDLAAKMGLNNRFKASREVDRVQAKLRGLVLAEVKDATLLYEDDLGPLQAVAA
jgi:hypothetical protein